MKDINWAVLGTGVIANDCPCRSLTAADCLRKRCVFYNNTNASEVVIGKYSKAHLRY